MSEIPTLAYLRSTVSVLLMLVHELGDAEHAERQRDDLDAIEQFGDAEGETRLPGLDVGTDDADQEPEHRHGDAP